MLDKLLKLRDVVDEILDETNLDSTVSQCEHCHMIKKASMDDYNAHREFASLRERLSRYIRKIEAGDWHGRDTEGHVDPHTAGTVRRKVS